MLMGAFISFLTTIEAKCSLRGLGSEKGTTLKEKKVNNESSLWHKEEKKNYQIYFQFSQAFLWILRVLLKRVYSRE